MHTNTLIDHAFITTCKENSSRLQAQASLMDCIANNKIVHRLFTLQSYALTQFLQSQGRNSRLLLKISMF